MSMNARHAFVKKQEIQFSKLEINIIKRKNT